MPKHRLRRQTFDLNFDGETEPFDWPQDGASGMQSARTIPGLALGDRPKLEVIWLERAEDQ